MCIRLISTMNRTSKSGCDWELPSEPNEPPINPLLIHIDHCAFHGGKHLIDFTSEWRGTLETEGSYVSENGVQFDSKLHLAPWIPV